MTEPQGKAGELLALNADPWITDRLLTLYDAELRATGIEWALETVPRLRVRMAAEDGIGGVWVTPEGTPVGLASWDPPTEIGRRSTWIYLTKEGRSVDALSSFLRRLDEWTPRLGPIQSIMDILPGVSLEGQRASFGPLGYVRVVRTDMEYPPARAAPPSAPGGAELRPLRIEDEGALADLLCEAYADAPTERALFQTRRDPRVDAREAIYGLLRDGLGTPWLDASFGVVRGDRLVAATLVHDFQGPLLSEVLVAPDFRRQGYARALVGASVVAVRARTRRPLRLVVTEQNVRAVHLYESMGFQRVPGASGGVWLKLPPP